jgi:hypothetical protein
VIHEDASLWVVITQTQIKPPEGDSATRQLSKPTKDTILVGDILAELLEYGGISSTTPPALYIWRNERGVERRIEIKTFEQFLTLFGIGTYQIYIADPVVDNIDPEKFTLNSLSITLSYLGDSNWTEPRIQTDEEEITPDYAQDFNAKVKGRAQKIAKKGQGALTIISILLDLYSTIKHLTGS